MAGDHYEVIGPKDRRDRSAAVRFGNGDLIRRGDVLELDDGQLAALAACGWEVKPAAGEPDHGAGEGSGAKATARQEQATQHATEQPGATPSKPDLASTGDAGEAPTVPTT